MSRTQEIMKPYRDRIDALDDQIVDLMIERFKLIREVSVVKHENKIPAIIEERIAQVIDRAGDRVEAALPDEQGQDDADRIREIYALMVVISCDLEEEILKESSGRK